MFGYHVSTPRIPGCPLGCCKRCRQRARYSLRVPTARVCPRCGLDGRSQNTIMRDIKKFVSFEDGQGNVLLKQRIA